jgi:hypothetical protein
LNCKETPPVKAGFFMKFRIPSSLAPTEETDSSLGMPSLVKVLVDTYAVGIPVSRPITRNLDEDVSVRVLANNPGSDVRTFSDLLHHIRRS